MKKIGKTIGAIGGEIVSKTLVEPIPYVGPILGPPVQFQKKMGEVIGRYRKSPPLLKKGR